MRTVSIFRNGKNQAVRLPKDMEFEGITELEIIREGDAVILRPARPDCCGGCKNPGRWAALGGLGVVCHPVKDLRIRPHSLNVQQVG